MDTSKVVFFLIVAFVCFITTFFVKNRQRYFLFLLVLFTPLSVGIIFRHYNGVFIMDIPLLILLFYGMMSSRTFRFYFGLPAVAMILWNFGSAFGAPMMSLAISELTRLVRAYLAFLCVANFTRTKEDVYAILIALLAGLALQGTIGYFQWHYGSLGLTFLGEADFEWRARGLFLHPSFFGNYLVMLIPVVLRLFVFYKPERRVYTVILGLLLSISMAALYGSYARGPWIAFAAAMAIMVLYTLFQLRFYPRVVSAAGFLVLIGAVFVINYTPVIVNQFTDKYRQDSTDVRMPLNKVAFRMMKDNIVFGAGIGNYELASHKYISLEDITEEIPYEYLLQRVHNSYLLIAAEVGLPGFLLFVWFLIYVFKSGRKVVKIKHPLISNIGLGLLTGFVGLLITLLASPDYREHQILMLIWVVAGYITGLSKFRSVQKKAMLKNKNPRYNIDGRSTSIKSSKRANSPSINMLPLRHNKIF